jgi:hypothetical protein
MSSTRRDFLQASATVGAAHMAATSAATNAPLDAFQIARRHTIVRDLPTPNFFEGMLLGNGDIGVVATVRADALGLHIGKEDSWDIRVSEDHYQHVLPFKELLKLWERASAEAKRQGQPEMRYLETGIDFFAEYTRKVRSSYAQSWPRPWPCGIVWIHWDSRQVEVVEQRLDPSNGMFHLKLAHDNLRGARRLINVIAFVNWNDGHVHVSSDVAAPFVSVAYYPNIDASAKLPAPALDGSSSADFAEFGCYQHFPAVAPTEARPDPPRSPDDRSFMLCGRLAGAWTRELAENRRWPAHTRVFFRAAAEQPFRLDLTLFTTRDRADNVAHARRRAADVSKRGAAELSAASEKGWRGFWSRSAVEFADQELERNWYHNQYWLACCLREGKVAPGLFGNWTSGKIGTAWHGDYHMNYNTQQVWWGVFSSNHVDQHLPYVELVENLLPLSEKYARENFELPGAFFPHSAYPVPSQTIAYPVPSWGYEICETPWTVQSLWWHYLYTLDKDFLKRAYTPMRAAARFLAAYLRKEEDGRYHVFPTVSPENYGFTVDYRLNKNCIMDLALTEFLLDAVVEASKILGADENERARWIEIRRNLAPYPKAQGPYGEVWLDVDNAPLEWVYNIPVTLAPVFPGEQVGLDRGAEDLEIARRTARTIRLEGGNDVVYQPLIRARLGMLDLGWFKREVRFARMPNGITQDRVRQIDGRYRDSTDVDFMMRMGVWTENLALPAVLNECLMQSYAGVIRLFPNTRNLGRASFRDLRAVGAMLVSASWDGREASGISIMSEKGAACRMANPWPRAGARVVLARDGSGVEMKREAACIEFATQAGERYNVEKVSQQ